MFSQEIITIFKQAGWYPSRDEGRFIELPSSIQYPISIQLLLREYGGLTACSRGPGISICKNSIKFEPIKAEGEMDENGTIEYFSNLLHIKLYHIGYIMNESLFLCIDDKYNVYMLGDYIYWTGRSFTAGISNILLGVAGRQLEEVTLAWK